MFESDDPYGEKAATQRLREETAAVTKALAKNRDIGFNSRKLSALFSDYSECIFLKDLEGQIVYSNQAHNRLYASHLTSTIGLKSVTFLDPSMIELSLNSDSMLIHGCEQLKFLHVIGQRDGSGVKATSVKLALQDDAGKAQGIIGLSRPIMPSSRQVFSAELSELSSLFDTLRPEERQVAKYVCDGIPNKKIAAWVNASTRTVENRRRNVLKKLGIESTAELIKVVVRLEDAGFIRMGV